MNELLRQHVTRVGFDLSLARSHIAALVELDQAINRDRTMPRQRFDSPVRRVHSLFAVATAGLIERGLVRHHYKPEIARLQKHGKHKGAHLAPHYSLTRAGELCVELLKESGLYAEYLSAFEAGKGA